MAILGSIWAMCKRDMANLLAPSTYIDLISYAPNTLKRYNSLSKIILFNYLVEYELSYTYLYLFCRETIIISVIGDDGVPVDIVDFTAVSLYNSVLALVEDSVEMSIEEFTQGHFHYLDVAECARELNIKD